MRAPGKWVAFLGVLPALFGFDVWTKEAARQLPVGGHVSVVDTEWISLAWLHAENPDIAFSIPVPMPVILGFGFLVLGILAHTLWSMRSDASLGGLAVGTLCAGALGNLVDRLADGSVTDFVAVSTRHPTWGPWLVEHAGTSTWPIFNVADVALLGGVLLYAATAVTEPDATDDDPSLPSGSPVTPG